MQKEIGSNFDLNPNLVLSKETTINLEQFGIEGTDKVFLSSGRSAQTLVLEEIERRNPALVKTALIPPFTCETVIEPFIKRGYKIYTYSIGQSLQVDARKFKKELNESQAMVVLIHQYFGFNTCKSLKSIIEEARKLGTVFIEDRTQCLYSGFPVLSSDYIVGSLRKWAALPDGGYAVCKSGKFHIRPKSHHAQLEAEKMEAAYLKYDYLHHGIGDKEVFLKKFNHAERFLNEEDRYYAISPMSVNIQGNMDIDSFCYKRRGNYLTLYNGIKKIKYLRLVTGKLSIEEVPLYLAVSTEHRDALQNFLKQNQIYAPVVWPKADISLDVCQEADELYKSILCFPIDQRYDIEDMERVIIKIKEYFEKWK